MSTHKVKIVATSAEEFAGIESKLAELPDVIYEQIESARNHVGLECFIRDIYGSDKKLLFPNTFKQQSVLDGRVHIYCGGGNGQTEYRFVIPTRMCEKPVSFQLIDMKPMPYGVPTEAQKVKVMYDNQPNEVANTFAVALADIGVTVTELEGGDGFNLYEIKK